MRSSSVTDARVLGSRTVAIGITSVIVILLLAAFFLFSHCKMPECSMRALKHFLLQMTI